MNWARLKGCFDLAHAIAVFVNLAKAAFESPFSYSESGQRCDVWMIVITSTEASVTL
jgi:hypothetical protein